MWSISTQKGFSHFSLCVGWVMAWIFTDQGALCVCVCVCVCVMIHMAQQYS